MRVSHSHSHEDAGDRRPISRRKTGLILGADSIGVVGRKLYYVAMADDTSSPSLLRDPRDASLHLPPGLRARLEEFRRRLWYVKVLEGVLAAAFGLLLSYLVVFGLDRVFDTPGWLRVLILVVGASGLGILFPLKCHRWVWRQRGLEQAARLLRHRFPRLGDQLLGIVELARDSDASKEGEMVRSEALVRAAMAQVDDRVRDRDLSEGVPDPRHRRWGWAAVVVAALALTAMIAVPSAGRNALARWLMPWKDTERWTFAQIEDLENARVVAKAEPFEVRAVLKDSTEWKPETAKLRVADQEKMRAALNPEHDDYEFTVPPQTEAGKVSLRVGDETHRMTVVPKPRPELSEVKATVQLPDYLQYNHDPQKDVRGGAVTVVKGARVKFDATASSELAEATMDGEPLEVVGNQLTTKPKRFSESEQREFHWRDKDGLEPKQPLTLSISAVDDARPTVGARKLTKEQVVLVSEVISFEVNAGDDFGVRQVGLEWQGLAQPGAGAEAKKAVAQGDKLVAAGDPEKTTLTVPATFSAEREGVAPQTLQIRAFAEDYYPNGERGYSPHFVVHILSPDDHALYLTEQFGRWFRQAQEVYEQEQLLHDTNRELRELSADDLDKAENRRRIEQQAAAERNNAQRLGRLTDTGEDLVKQALRNEEFDADALERWARMLEQLDAIADEKMPSVAGLLKKAAEAAGQPQKPGSSQGQPGGEPAKPSDNAKPGEDGQANSPPNGKPKDGESGEGGTAPPKPQVPNVTENKSGLSGSGGEQAPTDPDAEDMPKAPSVADIESGFNEIPPKEDGDEPKEPKPAGSGKLTLPSTQLAGGVEEEEGGGGDSPPSPAQQGLDEALEAQRQLLAEFGRIADELQELLSSLEASTFVKRLKAASRRQLEVAAELNSSMLGGFGLDSDAVEAKKRETGKEIAAKEIAESETVQVIQSDLEAYFQRKQDGRFEKILTQMKDSEVVSELRDIGDTVNTNLNGRSIVSAEYWADNLDRWAEELVAASKCKPCEGGGGEQPSLPPAIVLKVMKILHGEIALREETREAEAARPQLKLLDYDERAWNLSATQRDLAADTDDVIGDIYDLPDGMKNFAQEVQLLHAVSSVMKQAQAILAKPETGPPAIAAETEAIELLLQSKRFNPNGGGGGGWRRSGRWRPRHHRGQRTGPPRCRNRTRRQPRRAQCRAGDRIGWQRVSAGVSRRSGCVLQPSGGRGERIMKSFRSVVGALLLSVAAMGTVDARADEAAEGGEKPEAGAKNGDDEAAAEDAPESKPAEEKQLLVPKRNGGAVRIELKGQGQMRVVPGGAIRVLPGRAPQPADAKDAKKKKADEKAADGENEEGDDEKTTEDKIAEFLKKREAEARKPRVEQMQRRIEELEEIVGLQDSQRKKLQIASKGAVEKSLEPWRQQMDNYIRQYLERAPQNVDMMLASIGNVNFGHSPEQQAAEQKIWQATIKGVLDGEQMATYQRTVDERNDFLHQAVSGLLIADLDRNLRLSSEQRDGLDELLRPVIKENLKLLGRWSNDGNLPVYQLPTLLGGVKEKDLKKVLSEQQIEGWQARFARFKSMWQSIQQQQKAEEQEAKAKKEREVKEKEGVEKDGGDKTDEEKKAMAEEEKDESESEQPEQKESPEKDAEDDSETNDGKAEEKPAEQKEAPVSRPPLEARRAPESIRDGILLAGGQSF